MYYLLEEKRVTGPFEEEDLRERIYRGQLKVSTLACRADDAQEKWAPLEQLMLGIGKTARPAPEQVPASWRPPADPYAPRYPTRVPPDPNTAVLLEILPGIFTQVFGIGNIYAGNVGGGLTLMFGYWFIQFINLILCIFLIGIPLLIITFIAFLIISAKMAGDRARLAREWYGGDLSTPPGFTPMFHKGRK